MRDKIAKVVNGDKKWAEDVLKEAMIQEINADAKEGINIFIAEDVSQIKFNNFPNVEISKYQKSKPTTVGIDLYPGWTHKPMVTLTNADNFVWGDTDPEPEVVIKEKQVPVYVKQEPIIIEKVVKTPAPSPTIVVRKVEVEVPVPSPPVIRTETVHVPIPPPAPKDHTIEVEVMLPEPLPPVACELPEPVVCK